MDFAYSDKVRELQLRVQQFMDTHVTPNEDLYYQQVDEGGRWCVPPILDALKAKGVSEVWCVAVNDAFVMAHWGKDQKAIGKIRFLADGSANWAKAMGLELDLTKAGMGVRGKRFSALGARTPLAGFEAAAPSRIRYS